MPCLNCGGSLGWFLDCEDHRQECELVVCVECGEDFTAEGGDEVLA